MTTSSSSSPFDGYADPDDLRRLLGRGSWLRRFARALASDDTSADDLVQDALGAAMTARSPIRNLKAYLLAVVRRRSLEIRRSDARRRAREVMLADGQESAAPGADVAAEQIDTMRMVLEELQHLPDAQRVALTQRFVEEMTAKEIARRVGLAESTVRANIARGLETLRKRLDRRSGGRAAWAATLVPWRDVIDSTGALSSGATLVTWKAAVMLIPLACLTIWMAPKPAENVGSVHVDERNLPAGGSSENLAPIESGSAGRSPIREAETQSGLATGTSSVDTAPENAAAQQVRAPVAGTAVDALTGEPVPSIELSIAPVRYALPAGHPPVGDLELPEKSRIMVSPSGPGAVPGSRGQVQVTTGADGSFASIETLVPGRVRVVENDRRVGPPAPIQESTLTFPFTAPILMHVGPTFRLSCNAQSGIPWDRLQGSFASPAEAGRLRRHAAVRAAHTPWIRFPYEVTQLDGDGPWTVEFFDSDGLWHAQTQVTRNVGIEPRPLVLNFQRMGAVEFMAERRESGLLLTGSIQLTRSGSRGRRIFLNASEDDAQATGRARFLDPGRYTWTRGAMTGEVDVFAGEIAQVVLAPLQAGSAGRAEFRTEITIDATAMPDVDMSEFQFSIVASDDLLRGFTRSPTRTEGDAPGMWRLVLDGLPDERWNVIPNEAVGRLRWEPTRTVVAAGTVPATFVARAASQKVSIRINAVDVRTNAPLPNAEGAFCTEGLSYMIRAANSAGLMTSTAVPVDRESHVFIRAPGYAMRSVRFVPEVDGTTFEVALERGWRAVVRVVRTEDLGLMEGMQVLVDGESRGRTNEYGLLWIEGDGPPSIIELGAGSEDHEVILSPFDLPGSSPTAPLVGYTFVIRHR